MGEQAENRFHRLAFYEGGWSNFDSIEPCGKPGYCIGCAYKHPFCTEGGRLISDTRPNSNSNDRREG